MLWDVDHTLVDAGGVGARAFLTAFRDVFGRDVRAPLPPMAGRTDRWIVGELLRRNGVPDPLAHLEEFRLAAERALAAGTEALRMEGYALPGAAEALAALAGAGTVQSLLTGNIRAFAETKMRVYDLGTHLDLDSGAYGWADAVRGNLVGIARSAAAARYGTDFTGPATVLVGDTPRDVEAARLGGAGVVAVATGRYTPAELRESGASVVLADLADTAAVVDAIQRATPPT